MGLLIYFLGPRIVHVFTKDAEAVRIALTVLGVVCFFQPLDALMLAQEGVLLGAREHAYISRSVIATSLTCFCALYLVTRTLGLPYTLLHVWLCVKILTMGRILFSSARLYASRHSPILVAAEAEAKEAEEAARLQAAEAKAQENLTSAVATAVELSKAEATEALEAAVGRAGAALSPCIRDS